MKKCCTILWLIITALSLAAETTLEMLQQKVEEGDPTAQTLMGLMYEHGYIFGADSSKATSWYEKGKNGNDEFAAKRLKELSSSSRKTFSSSSDARKSRTKSSSKSTSIEDLYAKACLAELESGKVDLEDLKRDRSDYTGKVIKLDFYASNFSSSSTSRIYIYDSNYNFTQYIDLPDDEDAIDWAIDCDKSGSGDSIYVYVESSRLLALGTRKKKQGSAMSYSW